MTAQEKVNIYQYLFEQWPKSHAPNDKNESCFSGLCQYFDNLYKSEYFPISALTTAEIIALQSKFYVLVSLCSFGSLQAVLDIVTAAEIDAIFTQPRKDKYIALLQSALS